MKTTQQRFEADVAILERLNVWIELNGKVYPSVKSLDKQERSFAHWRNAVKRDPIRQQYMSKFLKTGITPEGVTK